MIPIYKKVTYLFVKVSIMKQLIDSIAMESSTDQFRNIKILVLLSALNVLDWKNEHIDRQDVYRVLDSLPLDVPLQDEEIHQYIIDNALYGSEYAEVMCEEWDWWVYAE